MWYYEEMIEDSGRMGSPELNKLLISYTSTGTTNKHWTDSPWMICLQPITFILMVVTSLIYSPTSVPVLFLR